jgi:hypothetical protein
VEGIEYVKEDDHVFVRAAASVAGSILASTDGPLIAILTRMGIIERHGFAAVKLGAQKRGNDSNQDKGHYCK